MLREFFEQVNINLTNLFQNLDAVVECATHEGAYCDEMIGVGPSGTKQFACIPFLETEAPAWDKIIVDGETMTEEEFVALVLNTIQELIENGALDDEELEEDINNYCDGLGI